MCYRTENRNRSSSCSHHSDPRDPEPADPSQPDHNARRQLPLVPDSVKLNRIPDALQEDGQPLTVGEARKTYTKIQLDSISREDRTSKYERQRYDIYKRIHDADRQFIDDYDDLTTVMFTCRLSPLDGNGNWLTPWECDQMLHGGASQRSIRDALKYQLGEFEFGWVAVTAPTTTAGTPHDHYYVWIDDPENEITTDQIAPALNKHLKHCVNAYDQHHQYRRDGTDGAITYRHSPERTSQGNTEGATYVAKQLAHLPIGDYNNDEKPDPSDTLIEGAALAWASPFNWFRSSSEVKKQL